MLTQKLMGRVMTDLNLSALYEEMLKAASQTIIDRIQKRFNRYPECPTFLQQEHHLKEFHQRREAFLKACRQQNISVPRGLSLLQAQKFLLRQFMA